MDDHRTTRTVSRLNAYPVELTATQDRESADLPWGPTRFTLLFEGKVQAQLDQEAAKLYARFITDVMSRTEGGATVARDTQRFAHPSDEARPEMPDLPPEDLTIRLIRPMISQARAERETPASGS